MSEREDYADEPPWSRQRWMSVIGFVLVAASLVVILLCAVAFVQFSNQPSRPNNRLATDPMMPPVGGKEGDNTRVYTHGEFRALVIGKTREEVIAAIGRPAYSLHGLTTPQWVYHDRAIDPSTGIPGTAAIQFNGSVVAHVFWSP